MNLHPSKLITLVIAMYCCLLTVSEAQAGCSVHDHLCSYHAIGRISTPTIAKQLGEDPSNGVYSQSGLYIKSAWATNSSGKKADLDLEVLLPDKALAEDPRTSASLLSTYVNTGPFIINGVGYPPDGNPFDGIANEAPRHVGPDQYDITFMNSTARAIHSADANGANIIGNKPGVRPCTDSENCEFVQIKGNIPAGEYRAALTNYDYYNLSDPSTPVYIITAELTDDVKAKGGVIINKSHLNGYATGSIQNPDETSEHYVFDVYNSGFAPHAEGEAYDDFKRNFYGKTKYADPQTFTDGIYDITTQKRYRDEWTNAYTRQIFSDGSVSTTNHGTVARRNNVYLGEDVRSTFSAAELKRQADEKHRILEALEAKEKEDALELLAGKIGCAIYKNNKCISYGASLNAADPGPNIKPVNIMGVDLHPFETKQVLLYNLENTENRLNHEWIFSNDNSTVKFWKRYGADVLGNIQEGVDFFLPDSREGVVFELAGGKVISIVGKKAVVDNVTEELLKESTELVTTKVDNTISNSNILDELPSSTSSDEIRFITNTDVTDRKTKKTYNGTVDVKPTLNRIDEGISYPHKNDGGIFKNDDTKLPEKPYGYYKEYVVPSSMMDHVGPQRIVIGKGGEKYYTPDHYDTFIPLNGN